ncbi:probable serine/threonine-protein kinase clkA isoform X2 [Hyposmocoma kahamanoa]|uniref:probable serine/threonine-protein kinase clkA isoform X2 n=1 Tax=Hyposmocoma kahamanoa TaxID=1477025 RepID=UPI000E6D7E67|nr:probable serine/threonine-protein kinase clkA isoform X2 [Hyposmocoma kahamanoa]
MMKLLCIFAALLAVSLSEEVKGKKAVQVEEPIEDLEAAASVELLKTSREPVEILERAASTYNSVPPSQRPPRQWGPNQFNQNQYIPSNFPINPSQGNYIPYPPQNNYFPSGSTLSPGNYAPINNFPSGSTFSPGNYFPTSTPGSYVPTPPSGGYFPNFPNQNFIPQNDAPVVATTESPNYNPVAPQNPTPPQNNYNPPQNNYNPPQNNYNPPQNNYIPPQNNYNPPQNNYNPPQNNYNPQNPTAPQNDYYPQNTWTTTTPNSVIKNDLFFGDNGSYRYEYQLSDGTWVGEEGYIVNPNTKYASLVKKGWYSYIGADGKKYTTTYWAGDSGYYAYGDHLPTPPPIPPAIQAAQDQIAKDEQAKAEAEKNQQQTYPQPQPTYPPQSYPQNYGK